MTYIRRDLFYPNNTLKAKQNTPVVIVSIRDCMALCDTSDQRIYVNVVDLVELEQVQVEAAPVERATQKRGSKTQAKPVNMLF